MLSPTWNSAAILARLDPQQLVFLDESGLDTRLTRAYARAAPGERAVGQVPGGHGERLTVIGALGLEGVVPSMSLAAATSAAVFLARVYWDGRVPLMTARCAGEA